MKLFVYQSQYPYNDFRIIDITLDRSFYACVDNNHIRIFDKDITEVSPHFDVKDVELIYLHPNLSIEGLLVDSRRPIRLLGKDILDKHIPTIIFDWDYAHGCIGGGTLYRCSDSEQDHYCNIRYPRDLTK